MTPLMATDILLAIISAGVKASAIQAQAQAEGREVDFNDVKALVAENDVKRAEFDAALANWESQQE